MKALSIRQPWAWFVAQGLKPLENRNWETQFRGEFLIHASGGMTKAECEDCFDLVRQIPEALKAGRDAGLSYDVLKKHHMGGFVGIAEVVGCVSESDSPWFFGKYGFEIANARPLAKIIPFKGQLGFFNVPEEIENEARTLAWCADKGAAIPEEWIAAD